MPVKRVDARVNTINISCKSISFLKNGVLGKIHIFEKTGLFISTYDLFPAEAPDAKQEINWVRP